MSKRYLFKNKKHMKERKTKQIRIRLTESLLEKMVNYLIDHPNEFKNQSQLIRESIDDIICRKGKNKQGKNISNSKSTSKR
jgi:Arc/MetJ-type ribon-helix-helix transcriptional regulator